MTVLTKPFTLSRWQVALAASIVYLRTLWWLLVAVPLTGLAAFVFAPNDFIRTFGLICLMWPLTIPLRGLTASTRAGYIYRLPTVAAVDADYLYLRTGDHGMKLGRRHIRSSRLINHVWCIQTRNLSVLFLPNEAVLDPESRKYLENLTTAAK